MNYDYLKEFKIYIDITIEDEDVDENGIVDMDKQFSLLGDINFGVSCFHSATNKKINSLILPSNTKRIGKKCFSEILIDTLDITRIISFDIDYAAFSGAKIKRIVALPNMANTNLCYFNKEVLFKYDGIDEITFENSYNYKGLNFEEGYTKIIFNNCSEHSLQTLTLPSTIKKITIDNGFSSLKKLKGIEHTQLKIIPDKFLYKNTNITSIKLPSSVEYIGKSAFAYMKELNLDFSKLTSLTTIEEYAFIKTHLVVKDIEFPMGIKDIGTSAFYGCDIESVSFPSTVSQISGHAFQLNYLTKVLLAATAITSVEEYAFAENGITEFTLPPYCFEIGEGAFRYNNIDVTKLKLDDIIVGPNAFNNNAT